MTKRTQATLARRKRWRDSLLNKRTVTRELSREVCHRIFKLGQTRQQVREATGLSVRTIAEITGGAAVGRGMNTIERAYAG